MTPRVVRLVVLALVGLAGYVGYGWWNSPERQIRRVLAAVADALSHERPAEGVAAIAGAAGLQRYLSAGVIVHPGQPFGGLAGRQRVLAAAAQLRAMTQRMDVDIVDADVDLTFGGSAATVHCTATATSLDRAGKETMDARELEIVMALEHDAWVIREVKVVQVLER